MPAEPNDPHFEARVRESFAAQNVMRLIGARLSRVEPGLAEIDLDSRGDLTQQNGYVHAGIVTTILDSACGYAAYTLMPADSGVLTVEYKVNFLRPASGEKFVGIGRVIKPGRNLTVCLGEALAYEKGEGKLIATMQATMMAV